MKKLYRVTIKDKIEDAKRTIYVASSDMIEATKILCDKLSADEELVEINEVSEECYV